MVMHGRRKEYAFFCSPPESVRMNRARLSSSSIWGYETGGNAETACPVGSRQHLPGSWMQPQRDRADLARDSLECENDVHQLCRIVGVLHEVNRMFVRTIRPESRYFRAAFEERNASK